MSVETGSSTEETVPPLAVPRGFLGLAGRRGGSTVGDLGGARPGSVMRRDALFRRMLLIADVLALVGAFALTVALSRRSLQLTWAAAPPCRSW